MDPRSLPGWRYIELIRQHLWCGREYGRAAVMIGTGFSRNATRICDNIPPVPLWREFACEMYRELYPDKNPDNALFENPLQLARKYELVFGWGKFNEFLATKIPDGQYTPNKIHTLLLGLPWADVFTTNYDTLLERACFTVPERKYNVVYTKDDLTSSMQPRIVKLHGSFPSYRPFIMTEEHYRRYPDDFAPFVNTVQQSMMENVFCLLGFSGDDPNFLQWIGWVRDNLGEAAPPIFLCGLFDFDEPTQKLLMSRNVTTIELSPLFPVKDWPDTGIRHANATEWFLRALQQGRPYNKTRWPLNLTSISAKEYPNLPPIPKVEDSITSPRYPYTRYNDEKLNTIVKAVQKWREERLKYPGWLVCPHQKREYIWVQTENTIDEVNLLKQIDNLQPPDDLRVLYELAWRLDIAHIPLYTEWSHIIAKVVGKYNPFPTTLDNNPAAINPTATEYKNLPWDEISRKWVELVFALIQDAREEYNEIEFGTWTQRLEPIVENNHEWKTRLEYEKCLLALAKLDEPQLRQCIDNWEVKNEQPVWFVRRAAILAELGDIDDAYKLASDALNLIRERLDSHSVDHALLSQEGWTLYLLTHLDLGKGLPDTVRLQERTNSRREKLLVYDCDPWTELQLLQTKIKAFQEDTNEVSIRPGFDPRKITRTFRFTSDKKIQLCWGLLRTLEKGCIPYQCGYAAVSDKVSVEKAARLMTELAPVWALSIFVRLGSKDGLEAWLDRVCIASIPEDTFTQLISVFQRALQGLISSKRVMQSRLSNNTLEINAFRYIPETLSRLCLRCTQEQRNHIFDIACDLYKMPILRDSGVETSVRNLFARLFYATPDDQMFSWLPRLLALPICGEPGFYNRQSNSPVEPCSYINWSREYLVSPITNYHELSSAVSRLFYIMEYGSPNAREQAIERLLPINSIHSLDNLDIESFERALWKPEWVDAKSSLPELGNLLLSVLLVLPEPKPGIAADNLHDYLLDTGADDTWFYETLRASRIPFADDPKKRCVEWTNEDIVALVQKCIQWWSGKQDLINSQASILGQLDDTIDIVGIMVKLLIYVLLPQLCSSYKTQWSAIAEMAKQMQSMNVPYYLDLMPSLLFRRRKNIDATRDCILHGVESGDATLVKHAFFAIYYWAMYAQNHDFPTLHTQLLDTWSAVICLRRQPALITAIGQMAQLIHDIPSALNDNHRSQLLVGLGHLIEETAIPGIEQADVQCVYNAGIERNDRPAYREASAKLARELYDFYKSQNCQMPSVIKSWKNAGINDPLPEVWRVWQF